MVLLSNTVSNGFQVKYLGVSSTELAKCGQFCPQNARRFDEKNFVRTLCTKRKKRDVIYAPSLILTRRNLLCLIVSFLDRISLIFLQTLYVRAQNQIKTMKSQRNIISMTFNHDLVSYYRLRERRSSSEEVFHLSVSIP